MTYVSLRTYDQRSKGREVQMPSRKGLNILKKTGSKSTGRTDSRGLRRKLSTNISFAQVGTLTLTLKLGLDERHLPNSIEH
jgi:hypothetical protein